AGGQFTTAGGLISNSIARWDGSSWSSMGTGMNYPGCYGCGIVNALIEFKGKLIAGGNFSEAGGLSVNGLAQWDGTSWSDVGSGVTRADYYSPQVNALAIYNGDLIVGGTFKMAGDTIVNGIARWDGTSWFPLGTGIDYQYGASVLALSVYNGKLLAA